jgi:hypothetical protein
LAKTGLHQLRRTGGLDAILHQDLVKKKRRISEQRLLHALRNHLLWAIAGAVALFRYKRGVIEVIAACAVIGLAYKILGA